MHEALGSTPRSMKKQRRERVKVEKRELGIIDKELVCKLQERPGI